MPRWKALPDDLDPQIKEFAGQLRRLVDRSELSIAALADATGYSKTSWERYLNGRLLAPKGAIVALAEVTRTNPVHLTTMWELAERAWSRSEMRHDMTMEAIRISQARAALGELTTPESNAARSNAAQSATSQSATSQSATSQSATSQSATSRSDAPQSATSRSSTPRSTASQPEAAQANAPRVNASNATHAPDAVNAANAASAQGAKGAKEARRAKEAGWAKGGRAAAGGTVLTPGIAGPAGVSPTVPPVPAQPTAADSPDWAGARDSGPAAEVAAASAAANSWGMAGYRGPAPSGNRRTGAPGGPGTPVPNDTVALGAVGSPRPPVTRPQGGPPPGDRKPGPGAGNGNGGKRLATFVAGVVGVLVVVAGAFFLLNDGGEEKPDARPSPSPTVTTEPDLPAGVKCSGDQCTGKDAETMGCGGDLVTTERTATVGTTVVEVRYSKTCGTAWGRVTQAAQGDEVRVSAGGAEQTGSITVTGDTIAYTPMVAVEAATDAKACVTLASGEQGCTE
ncbi:DUF2690 domain-containing protein [Streptomyces sp. NPDC023723]|uniref:DUF2690 domain-containing protein n=1 Tax=Streptomyces sp. NPDC023723 TaxID=3154323 RepID=UPI0033E5852F